MRSKKTKKESAEITDEKAPSFEFLLEQPSFSVNKKEALLCENVFIRMKQDYFAGSAFDEYMDGRE